MRERSRQEWQKEKIARRDEAKARRQSAPTAADREARDLAGIVAGPQPSPWGEDPESSGGNTDKKDDRPA
jgi:hypothetical protein